MLNRRRFLEAGAVAGVGAMLPLRAGHAAEVLSGAGAGAAAVIPPVGVSPALTKYVDLLPEPNAANGFVYTPTAVVNGVEHYDIPVSAFYQALHRDLPATYLWGYGGTFPSKTIEAVVGTPIEVRWINNLRSTDPHPLAAVIDRTNVAGMTDMNGAFLPDQRITTHLHGGAVPWTSDGGPKTWYTGPFFSPTAPYGAGTSVLHDIYYQGTDTYFYPNNQPGCTLWYHDHAMGITRYNVIAGTAGFWLLRSPLESTLNLPSGAYEIPIAIQDRIFNVDGSLYYPPAPAVPEFFGDTMVVNGKVWPRLKVEPRKYRFRFLNGCNARFLRMQLVQATAAELLPSTKAWVTLPYTQIGAEGGFFAAPAAPATVMLLAPAERADVIIDFSAQANKKFILFNDAAIPFANTADTRGAIPEVMIFDVSKTLTGSDTSVIPASFGSLGGFIDANGNPDAPDLAVATSVPKTLTEIMLPNGMLMQLINGTGYDTDPLTGAPSPDEVVRIGTTEIWQIVNATVDVHPIHLHQTMFKVLDRQKIGISQYMGKVAKGKAPPDPTPYLKGAPIPAGPDEAGWKETVRSNPGEVVRIAMKWKGYDGNYVYHCHILEHEEHDMMRALKVLPAAAV